MNEPKYIVYALSRFSHIYLNIIEWKTRRICEYVKECNIFGHLKRLTPNLIKPDFESEEHSEPPNGIFWCREDEGCVLSNEELYQSATVENIKEVIEELEGTKLHYMYFIY